MMLAETHGTNLFFLSLCFSPLFHHLPERCWSSSHREVGARSMITFLTEYHSSPSVWKRMCSCFLLPYNSVRLFLLSSTSQFKSSKYLENFPHGLALLSHAPPHLGGQLCVSSTSTSSLSLSHVSSSMEHCLWWTSPFCAVIPEQHKHQTQSFLSKIKDTDGQLCKLYLQ